MLQPRGPMVHPLTTHSCLGLTSSLLISTILTPFHRHQLAASADISKVFREVVLHLKDKDLNIPIGQLLDWLDHHNLLDKQIRPVTSRHMLPIILPLITGLHCHCNGNLFTPSKILPILPAMECHHQSCQIPHYGSKAHHGYSVHCQNGRLQS